MVVPVIGAGLMVGGSLLNAYGQYRGNRAMSEEARRQYEEEQRARAAMDLEVKNNMYRQNIAGGAGGAEIAARGRALAPMNASAQQAGVLGAQLGTGGRGMATINQGELDRRVGAIGAGAADVAGANAAGQDIASTNIGRIEANQALNRSNYQSNLMDAASRGGAYRQIGGLMTTAGSLMFGAGLNSEFIDPAIDRARAGQAADAATATDAAKEMERQRATNTAQLGSQIAANEFGRRLAPQQAVVRRPIIGAPAGYPGPQQSVLPGEQGGIPAGYDPSAWWMRPDEAALFNPYARRIVRPGPDDAYINRTF